MPRTARTALAALALPLLLAACGSGEATRGDVAESARNAGLSDEEAECVANGLFDPERFSKEERDAATSAADGDRPDPDLAEKVQALVNECDRGEPGSE